MIWASAISGAVLAMISAVISATLLGFPLWLAVLVYLVTSGIFTGVIFAFMVLRANRAAQQRDKADLHYPNNDLQSSLSMAVVQNVLPPKK